MAAAAPVQRDLIPALFIRASDQSMDVSRNIKNRTYGEMIRTCNSTGIRFAAVPTVVAMYLTENVACLAAAVEDVVKGLINIGGAIAYGITGWEAARECKIMVGLKLLFIDSLLAFYGKFPITLFVGVLVMLIDLINLLKTGLGFTPLRISYDEYVAFVQGCSDC